MNDRADVVVVGGGVIGCAVAWALAREGVAVAVLERDSVAAHASSVAAGMLAPFAEAHGEDAAVPLGAASLAHFPDVARELAERGGVDPRLSLCGVLRVARDDASAARLRARAAGLAREG
ncbi:MAG: glycine oxidase ThiO, partial [Proteobacteria bacterium]